jgi:hypothetical protein
LTKKLGRIGHQFLGNISLRDVLVRRPAASATTSANASRARWSASTNASSSRSKDSDHSFQAEHYRPASQ